MFLCFEGHLWENCLVLVFVLQSHWIREQLHIWGIFFVTEGQGCLILRLIYNAHYGSQPSFQCSNIPYDYQEYLESQELSLQFSRKIFHCCLVSDIFKIVCIFHSLYIIFHLVLESDFVINLCHEYLVISEFRWLDEHHSN